MQHLMEDYGTGLVLGVQEGTDVICLLQSHFTDRGTIKHSRNVIVTM